MVVRELITRLGFSTNTAQLNKAEKATEKLKSRANETAMAFRNIAISIASFATIKSLISAGDEMQSLRARIAQLPQTLGDSGDAFDDVAKRAIAAKQGVSVYTNFFIKAGNATQDFIDSQSELLDIVDGAAMGLAASGALAASQSQAFFQLGQAIGSPVVQMEEMNTLIDVAPDLFRALGNAIPGANGQLKKFISTGQVTGKMLAEGLQKVAPMFRQKMKGIPITVDQAARQVADRWGMMIDRMNRKTRFIEHIANLIIGAFNKIEIGIDALVDAFDGWGNMLRLVGIALSVALGAKAIAILMALGAVSWTVLLPFIQMAALIGAVALAFEDLYLWIQGGDSLLGALIGPWEEWRIVVMGAVEAVAAVFRWLGEIIGAVAAVWVGVFTFDLALITEGLKDIGALLQQVVGQWGTWIYDAIFSPIINAVKDGWNTIKGMAGDAWESAKGFVGVGTSPSASPAGTVTAAQLAPGAMGAQRPSISNNTQVTVTVPPGTTAEQAKFLQTAAERSFSKANDAKLARDLSVYAP